MADFSTQKSFIDLASAHAALTAIAKQQGFKVAKRPTPTGSRLAFDRVVSFHCTNASRGCIWQIVLSRSVADADTPWTVYNLCDVHRGVCRPAQLRRKRQASESTVETISTDESDLDIPRELREPRVRSPSLFVPAPSNSKPPPIAPAPSASQALHPGLALPALGINLQTSGSSNNDEPTPDLTPATTHTSAQTKSPTPDPGAFTAYLEDLLRSLDDPAPGPLPDAGTIDPSAIMAALDQPLSLDFGLPEGTMEWRKGATGAHEFLTNMGSEGRKALQPRLERAVSVLQTLNPEAVLQPTTRTQHARPFANAAGTAERLKSASPFPFGMALHGYSPAPEQEERNPSPSEGYGMQLNASESVAEEERGEGEEASSDDDIPPETLINPGAVTTNSWRTSRQASAEQYVSPMNLLSPAKTYDHSPESAQDEADVPPLASTSAAGALLEAAAARSSVPPAEEFVIPRDPDCDIDIYAIFSSYKHAEATLLANGERFGLPLRVAWAPGHPASDGREKRGACLVCVHAGPEGSGVGCGYSVRLSDDSLGKWRLVTSEGEHLPSCYPPKKALDTKGKGRARPPKEQKVKAKTKPVHKTRTSYLGAPGSVDRTRLPRAPGESFIGSSTNLRNSERALSPISSFQSTSNTAHRNPLLPKRSYMRPRSRSRSRSGSGTESSSPGVVVQASWKPQTPYRVQNHDGSSSTSTSPQGRRERLRKSGSTKDAPIDLDEEDKSADEDDAQLRRRKRQRRPRFADQDEVLEISSGDNDEEKEEELPPPLSEQRNQHQMQEPDRLHHQPLPSASSRPAYARKKLPPSPAHRTPTKPFQARKIRPKPRRPGYAWIEEPAFIANTSSSSKLPKELTSSHLNGGYWRKVDDTGNIVPLAQREEEEGRALRSRRRRRAVQTDGVGGKKPVETVVERRRVALPPDEDREEEYRIQSSEDDGEAYREPGERATPPRSLRSSARRPALRSTRARTRRPNAPSRQPPSPGLSFDSRFAFGKDDDDLPASHYNYDDYNEEKDSPPSPAIAKSALPTPHPRRRSLAARAALAGPSASASAPAPASALPEIPARLIGNMSLSSIGFRTSQVDLLAFGGFYTVSQLTREGLHCVSEDFSKFRDQFDEKRCFSAQMKPNRGDVKAVVTRIVWEIRANAVLEWEAAGMMESDYEDDDAEEEMEEQEQEQEQEADESTMMIMKEAEKQAEPDEQEETEIRVGQPLPFGRAIAQDDAEAAREDNELAEEGQEEGPVPDADVDMQAAASPSPPPPSHEPNKPASPSDSPPARPFLPLRSQLHRSSSLANHHDPTSPSSALREKEEAEFATPTDDQEEDEEDEEQQESPPRFVLYDYPAVDPDDSEDEFTIAMREIDREEAAEAAAAAGVAVAAD